MNHWSENHWNAGDDPLPKWAERRSSGNYMEPGAQLATRDGRKIGNAHVDEVIPDDELGQLAVVVTDMGNTFRMTATELEEMFYPPSYVMRLEELRAGRNALPESGNASHSGDAILSLSFSFTSSTKAKLLIDDKELVLSLKPGEISLKGLSQEERESTLGGLTATALYGILAGAMQAWAVASDVDFHDEGISAWTPLSDRAASAAENRISAF